MFKPICYNANSYYWFFINVIIIVFDISIFIPLGFHKAINTIIIKIKNRSILAIMPYSIVVYIIGWNHIEITRHISKKMIIMLVLGKV